MHFDTLSHCGNWRWADDSAAECNIKPPFTTSSLFTTRRCKNLWHLHFRHHQLEMVPCQEQAHATFCTLKSWREQLPTQQHAHSVGVSYIGVILFLVWAHRLAMSGFFSCISNMFHCFLLNQWQHVTKLVLAHKYTQFGGNINFYSMNGWKSFILDNERHSAWATAVHHP